jgi:hypothetical protein
MRRCLACSCREPSSTGDASGGPPASAIRPITTGPGSSRQGVAIGGIYPILGEPPPFPFRSPAETLRTLVSHEPPRFTARGGVEHQQKAPWSGRGLTPFRLISRQPGRHAKAGARSRRRQPRTRIGSLPQREGDRRLRADGYRWQQSADSPFTANFAAGRFSAGKPLLTTNGLWAIIVCVGKREIDLSIGTPHAW